MSNQTPVELLREASAAIVKISNASGRYNRNVAFRQLAELTPKWVAVHDPQPQIDELKRQVQDLQAALSVEQRRLNDASDAYNDIEQTVVDALAGNSLEPLKTFAQAHPGIVDRAEYVEVFGTEQAVAVS